MLLNNFVGRHALGTISYIEEELVDDGVQRRVWIRFPPDLCGNIS